MRFIGATRATWLGTSARPLDPGLVERKLLVAQVSGLRAERDAAVQNARALQTEWRQKELAFEQQVHWAQEETERVRRDLQRELEECKTKQTQTSALYRDAQAARDEQVREHNECKRALEESKREAEELQRTIHWLRSQLEQPSAHTGERKVAGPGPFSSSSSSSGQPVPEICIGLHRTSLANVQPLLDGIADGLRPSPFKYETVDKISEYIIYNRKRPELKVTRMCIGENV